MLVTLLPTLGFALWSASKQERSATAVKPMRIDRLALPVYGTEHLLQLSPVDEDCDLILPVLLRYPDGVQLEKLGSGQVQSASGMALGLECASRAKLFEAASRRPLIGEPQLNPLAAMRLADGCASFSECVLKCLASNGWMPRGVELGMVGGRSRYREEVTNREMGAFTEAAPSSVRVGELVSLLRCVGDDGEELLLALEGPGEALLLSLYAGGLPMLAAEGMWEQRAVTAERLPELLPDQSVDLSRFY